MKIIYSLKEFHQKAVEVSGRPEEHVQVSVTYGLFGKYSFTCYADGLSTHFQGKTMEESLVKMREEVSPTVNNIDVEIEQEVSDAEESKN